MPSSLEIVSEADGVGPSTLEKIREAGYENAEEMGEKSPAELADYIDGVGFKTAVNILKVLEANNLRQRDPEEDNLYQLIELLEDLFYFDKEDQNFGIPKLMNQRRERLEQFIDEDLIEAVHASIEEMEQNISESELEEAREKVINEINEDAIKPNGEVAEEYKDSDISSVREVVENYQEKRKQAEEIEERENARAEVYNHIYQFFNRYYDKGDFITQRYRTQHQPPYSVPYDGANTYFHWVTRNQYYAKTSEHYTRFSFNHKGYNYKFVTENDTYEGNTVGDSEYFVMEDPSEIRIDEEAEKITIVFYRRMIGEEDLERCGLSAQTGNKQKSMNSVFVEEISERLRDSSASFKEDFLNSKLTEYTARNQSDFFIHKNLNSFLMSELDDYIKSEIINFEPNKGTEGIGDIALEKSRAVNKAATQIISFLDQIEELKKKIFEKKKFVTNSYTLMPVKELPEEHYDRILSNGEQKAQWANSYGIDSEELSEEDLNAPPYDRMIADTELIGQPKSTKVPNNKLIKGENYQALSFLEETYQNRIDAIYIDPPYNTQNPNFAYKDSYERPVWLSMMYDRLKAAKKLLSDDGVIFTSIDHREFENLKKLMNEIFGEENHIGTFVWKRRNSTQDANMNISTDHEYVLAYSGSGDIEFKGVEKSFKRYSNPDNDPRGPWRPGDLKDSRNSPESRPSAYYPITDPETGTEFLPENGTVWVYSKDKMGELIEEGKIIFPDDEAGTPAKKRFKSEVDNYKAVSTWIEPVAISDDQVEAEEDARNISILRTGFTGNGSRRLIELFGDKKYDYPKPVQLIREMLDQVTEDGDTVLDFFAGSGTTGQAVMELNRERDAEVNYILVELLEEASKVMEERIRRLAYTDKWSDGEPEIEDANLNDFDNDNSLANSVQVIEIESYEDALDSVDFGEEQSGLSQHTDYLLNYMLDFETVSASLMKTGVDRENDIFSKPLEYKLNRDAQKDTTADLMTTFNYLLGLREVEYEQTQIDGVDYSVYKGVMEEDDVLIIWRHDASEVEDYETEREEFDAEDYDHIYVNGDSAISGAKLISSAFNRKMFGGE